jgi:hypothetical protein
MKSVYVDDILHQKLKRLARENGQTLLALLHHIVQEGIERMEHNRSQPHPPMQDPVGMFGVGSCRLPEIDNAYGGERYQGVGEADERF